MQVGSSSVKLYRDCLRLVNHIAGNSRKGQALKKIVRGEFKKNAKVEDPATVEGLKSNAVKALANYLMLESSQKDGRFKQLSNQFYKNEAKDLNNVGNVNNNSSNNDNSNSNNNSNNSSSTSNS
jgi:hypothetical protein